MTAPTAAQIRGALDLLGDTPDRVADTLAAKGHAGCRLNAGGTCPVHNYLAAQFPEVAMMAVFSEKVIMSGVATVALPGPVAAFIRRFDGGGAYPELAEEPG